MQIIATIFACAIGIWLGWGILVDIFSEFGWGLGILIVIGLSALFIVKK